MVYDEKISRRFWEKVDIRGDDACWEWLAGHMGGYGSFGIHSGKTTHAHRVAWEFANDQYVPDGLYVCHSCDNRKCVNPKHLWLGTHADNMLDKRNKKRGRTKPCPGSSHPMARLTEQDIVYIRRAYADRVFNQRQLARMYDVSFQHMSLIIRGKRWAHVKIGISA